MRVTYARAPICFFFYVLLTQITCPLKLLVPCLSSSTLRSCCCQGQAVGVLRVLGRVPMLRKVCTFAFARGWAVQLGGALSLHTHQLFQQRLCRIFLLHILEEWVGPARRNASERACVPARAVRCKGACLRLHASKRSSACAWVCMSA